MKKLFLLLLAGGAALLAADKAGDKPADKIAGGPFVVNATSRTATVVWIVQTDELTLQGPAGSEAAHVALAARRKDDSHGPETEYALRVRGGWAGGGQGVFQDGARE